MKRVFLALSAILLAALAGGCTQGNSGDEAAANSGVAVPLGLNRFLLFPNPQVLSSGAFETDTPAYAQAYYAAIDPGFSRTTLANWKFANAFDTGGQQFTVVFRDVRDLGYGRRMTGRRNADGSIAFLVENYHIDTVPGGYSTVNVDAAVARDTQWHVGTNAIEWSCHPQPAGCARPFAKFYNFNSATGERQSEVNLDGRGVKSMPNICTNCHGGRGDPLDLDGSFPKVANIANIQRGDVMAKLQGFNVDSFEWSASPGYTRADQEAVLKIFNQWVLCTYPAGGLVTGTWGTCNQPAAAANEWQATAAQMIHAWYGGDISNPVNAVFSDTYLPAGWAGDATLYNQVVAPYCRTCHILRGTGNQSDIDFITEAKFLQFTDRIKVHVFDRGNMPLAFLVYQDFWRSSAPATLAAYLDADLGAGAATTGGAPKQPGRPIANAGPAVRMARTNVVAPLSAADSLFASTYNWTVTTAPGNAVIANPNAATTSFSADTAGVYTVQLSVANGGQSDSTSIDITVDAAFPDPAQIKFAHVKDVLRNQIFSLPSDPSDQKTCVDCHTVVGDPPIAYTNIDRDGVGGITQFDDDWFLRELRGRANLTEIAASSMLRKPSGNHHFGGDRFGFASGSASGLSAYSKILYWIMNGTPAGGVVADAGADTSPTLSFVGSPATASDAVSGIASTCSGSCSYAWSVVSQPVGGNASFANANAVSTTLSFQNVGTYVISLQISNGTDTNSDTRTITVSETAVAAQFTPDHNATASVSFDATTLNGPVTLSFTGSGNPVSCTWTQQAGQGSISPTNSCSTSTLTVPTTAVGTTVTVMLTVTGVNPANTSSTTHVFTIASAGSGITNNAGANSSNSVTFANPSTGNPFGNPQSHPLSSGIAQASIALNGSSSGPGTVTNSWSIVSEPGNATGSYAATVTNVSSLNTTLVVRRAGSYTVRLTSSNGIPPSATSDRTITVSVAAGNTFTAIKSIFTGSGCTSGGCHSSGSVSPPSWVDETVSSQTLHTRVALRVSTADPTTSVILTCPAEGCAMSQQNGFHNGNSTSYNTILNWIMRGAPND